MRNTMLLATKIFAALVALALATGAVAALQATPALAAEPANVTVGLTIVDQSDDTVLYNGKVSTLTAEDTVADLLAAAGYTFGTQEESALDERTYFDNYNYPSFRGKAWNAETYEYWASFINGAYDETGWETCLSAKLVSGNRYQYIYTDGMSYSYGNGVGDPLKVSPVNRSIFQYLHVAANETLDGINTALVYNEPLSAATAVLGLEALSGYQAAPGSCNVYAPGFTVPVQDEFTANLLNRFAAIDMESTGLEADYALVAMALANAGRAGDIDVEGLKQYYLDNEGQLTAGAQAKVILGLTAAGLDCQALDLGGDTKDLVKAMYRSIDEDTNGYSLVWVLPVCSLYLHNTGYETMVAKAVLSCQASNGLFDGGWKPEVQTTAQAVMGLTMYGKAPKAVDKAISAMESYQTKGGGVYETWSDDVSVDTTGAVLMALAAAGVEPDISKPAESISGASVKLSASTYTYSGSAKKPSVKVTFQGQTLANGTDYTVSYSGNTKVGTAKVTVTGIGAYKGSVSKSFTINPKGTSVSKVKAGVKKMKVYVKKSTVQTTGYQIRWSAKSSMKGAKGATISKAKYTTKTVGKLKSGSRYYVQVRTYTTVNGKKYYSGWSKAKRTAKIG